MMTTLLIIADCCVWTWNGAMFLCYLAGCR